MPGRPGSGALSLGGEETVEGAGEGGRDFDLEIRRRAGETEAAGARRRTPARTAQAPGGLPESAGFGLVY